MDRPGMASLLLNGQWIIDNENKFAIDHGFLIRAIRAYSLARNLKGAANLDIRFVSESREFCVGVAA